MSLTIARPTTSATHPSTPLRELSRCRTMRDLNQIHAALIKTGQIHDPLPATEILKLAAVSDFRDIVYARKVFDGMTERNSYSYNTMIRALAEGDEPLEAVVVLGRMMEDGVVKPNRFTFPSVLKGCAEGFRVEEGRQVHALVLKMGLEGDEFVVSNAVRMYVNCGLMEDGGKLFDRFNVGVGRGKRRVDGRVVLWNVMVGGYVRAGELEAARKLFDQMPERSVVSWNGIISGYAHNGFWKEALEVFSDMQVAADVCPNYVTLVSVLPAISGLGALASGEWVHLYAERNKITIDEVLGSALVDMYSKCGSIEKAVQLFNRLPQKNAVTWNCIIAGLAMHGRATEALDYFVKMEQAGVAPTDVTYIGLLSACSHAGLVNEGRSFFNHMTKVLGLEPRVEHYTCMVDLLGRAGLLSEAEELLLSMSVEHDDVIWKALLGACKMHGNVEMGERVAGRLMELAPRDSGSYVALSNMYASSGDWDEVAKVRLMMKNLDVRKDPGCSWIELDGEVHEFLVEDNKHQKAKEIHLMLEEISRNLMLAGHIPDTSNVLLQMDEEEKHSSIQYHGERIAVAFGLISTSSQTPLRIVKNLRICADCHSFMKLISRIYKRRIIVRDRKRFHHFEDGLCSCTDYW
uniref:DYW domain-containing protein n=1 Tax=Kalanchoe fedtschenkoi TaxID=63787 RepID=A0A7N0URB8_KALFE